MATTLPPTAPPHALDATATADDEPAPSFAAHFPQLTSARYKLGAEVGRGGLGRVMHAHDRVLDRDVAIKELHSDDSGARARFVREALITARLQHPSIVPIYEAGRWKDGAPFYAMKLVGGRPFSAAISETKTLSERLALLPIVLAVADALAFAHSRRIVHRDLKPGNILVGEFGETVVIDWGLAKDLSTDDPDALDAGPYRASNQDQTMAGSLLGTPAYMAPEQAAGEEIDQRADVYSLGAILYHVIIGVTPHSGDTLDAMIRRIIEGDITPITKLQPRAPLDLAALVGKAMARDREQRYPSAKELAEELRRFQTGQLVGTYRYSRRELVKRFVRRNRIAVTTASAAALLLIVGGTIAVKGIMGERNRADAAARSALEGQRIAEQARSIADDRTEKLSLQQARIKVTINPTEALAMVKPFAVKHWREVRSIANAARANGVAWSMPAPRRTETLEMSRDGLQALVTGDDGSIRVYDLAARTFRVIVERGAKVSARFAPRDRVVAWGDKQLRILDAKTGDRVSQLEAPTSIRDLELVDSTAFWVDAHGDLWQLELGGTVPVQLALAQSIDQILPSPDGRWIVLQGQEHLSLLDRTQPTAPPLVVTAGTTRDVAWADDSRHLAALVEDSVLEITITPAPQIEQRMSVGNRRFVAYGNGRTYMVGPTGVSTMSRGGSMPSKQLVGDVVGLRVSSDGVVIAGSREGLAILTDDGDYSIRAPTGRLDLVDASARSPYVIGMTEGRMLVWNTTEILPRRLSIRGSSLATFVGDDRVIAPYPDAPADWIELATGKTRSIDALTPMTIVASQDGRAACTIEMGHHAKLLVADRAAQDLGPAEVAVFAGDRLVLGLVSGAGMRTAIETVEIDTKQRTPLVQREARIVGLAATSAWVAAAFADGTLWRANLTSGAQSTTHVSQTPKQIAIRDDGAVLFADGRTLRSWRTGDPEPITELPRLIVALGIAGPDHAMAFADDGTGYVIELAARGRISAPVEVSATAKLSRDTGLVVFESRGSLDVLDPVIAHRWTLASTPGLSFTAPAISSDGRHILAGRFVTDRNVDLREPAALVVWTFEQPGTGDATAKYLDRLTNAVLDPVTSTIDWK